jgi:hypothetical protein
VTRHGRPHCEAFPPLDILKAARSLRHADGTCEWVDERGEVVGEGRIERLDAASALFTYRFSGSTNIAKAAGVLRLDVSGSRRNLNVVRYSFTCPRCAEPKQKIFFVAGSWACIACHDLVYLKQRLANVNKTIAYRDSIVSKISEMKKQERHTLAFHNLGRKLTRVERELEVTGLTSMPQELLYCSYDRWSGVASQITATATAIIRSQACIGRTECCSRLSLLHAKAAPARTSCCWRSHRIPGARSSLSAVPDSTKEGAAEAGKTGGHGERHLPRRADDVGGLACRTAHHPSARDRQSAVGQFEPWGSG